MTCRNQAFEQSEDGLRDLRRVEEFDHKREIDHDTQHIGGVNLTGISDPCNATENSDASDLVLVMQNVQNLLHQRLALAMIRLAQVDPDHCDVGLHDRTFHLRDFER
jgi:hypothetical protein